MFSAPTKGAAARQRTRTNRLDRTTRERVITGPPKLRRQDTTQTNGGAVWTRSGSSGAKDAALDAFFVARAVKDALDVDAGGDDGVGVELAHVDQLFDFGDGDAGSGGHHGIEIAGGLPVDKVAGTIAFPGFDQGVVGAQPGFEEIRAAVEVAGLLAFGDERAGTGGRVESGDACAACTNSLG